MFTSNHAMVYMANHAWHKSIARLNMLNITQSCSCTLQDPKTQMVLQNIGQRWYIHSLD